MDKQAGPLTSSLPEAFAYDDQNFQEVVKFIRNKIAHFGECGVVFPHFLIDQLFDRTLAHSMN